MLFDLQKALALLLMPLGLVWVLLLGLTLWSRRLRHPGFTLALGLVWLLLGLGGNPQVGQRLIARLEAQAPARDAGEGPILDALCVLGGGTDLDPRGRPQLGAHGDRVLEAARLWRAGRVRILAASGADNGDRDLAQETRALWLSLGVPDSAIRVVDVPCRNTREEIAAYRALRDRERWSRVGLLTSAWHLPRALALARKAGLEVTPLPCDHLGRPHPFHPQDLVPQLEGLRRTQTALWEMVGRSLGR